MGIYVSNYRFRLDISYILYHPQKPLVTTRTSKYVYTDVLSPGENCVVAIACYTGSNELFVCNRQSLQRSNGKPLWENDVTHFIRYNCLVKLDA